MGNIETYDRFISAKKKKEEELRQLDINNQNELNARKNGYDTYVDYEYSMYKIYSRDPRFSLSKVYYNKCQKYLLKTLKAYINYLRSGEIDNNSFVLTVYSLNELASALYEKNELVLSKLDKYDLSVDELLNTMSDVYVDIKKLKLK